MIDEKLEYAISQYLDGTLNEFDRRLLEERLAVDAEARLLVSEYVHLDALLKTSRPEPAVNFDRLASHLSSVIAEEDSHVAEPIPMFGTWVRRLSIAAGLALFVGIGLQFIPDTAPTDSLGGQATISVIGPTVEKAKAPPSVSIAVGPTVELQNRGLAMGLMDDAILTTAPRVVISAADSAPAPVDERLY